VATLKIEEICTTSIGGWPVVLTGLDPTAHDFIIGTIAPPGQPTISGAWNASGLRRGGSAQMDSLDINDPVIADLVALGLQLGAP
jgi:hypothetical protein